MSELTPSHARKAGVLLHISSLPNDSGNPGCLDHNAWRFVDWMHVSALKSWQVLPLNPTHSEGSPYNAVSAFAMNPLFLPQDWRSLLDADEFAEFLKEPPHWLHDYALFMSIRKQQNGVSWVDWPEALKYRDEGAILAFENQFSEQINEFKAQQFILQKLWTQLKQYANEKDIELYGDIPIFVSYDSADVWASPEQFLLDEQLKPTYVTGVPPDYFSETGQRWGNPHYDWEVMQADAFEWWQQRVANMLKLFDVVRIDHFRGLQASWYIESSEDTAINGEWREVPGRELLSVLQRRFKDLPIIAEDLGVITEEVVALKTAFDLPGMAVLQFGFNGLPDNPHALNEQIENSVAYTGTHDNDTTLGWFETESSEAQNWIIDQLKENVSELDCSVDPSMPWLLIAAAMKAVPQRVVIPMQDFLQLDSSHRMNVPGVAEGNWTWQFQWSQVPTNLDEKIQTLVKATYR
jgi:4-alpha-glucanotransferase